LLLPLFLIFSKTTTIQAQVSKGTVPEKYIEMPLASTRPKGWLLSQLKTMRAGTTGHLDEVYDKVKIDNGWLGGKGDGWEETPYWLDGALPLAYLLDDKILKNKVLRYVDWTLDNQRPSGYFGPLTPWERETGKKISIADSDKGEDWWPKMVMLKVLQQYYTATGDRRVVPFMTNYFHYQLAALKASPLGKWSEWATSRGADNVLVAQWLYDITKDESLLTLSAELQTQSYPWSDWFAGRDWVIHAAAQQNGEGWMSRHGVNVAMAIKDPVVQYRRTGDAKYLQALNTGFKDLMELHGLPHGMFSADEDIHGNDPSQGTELCAIVESMFSLEEAVSVTGDIKYMDALERMTFNALPAQTTDDYNNKQYYQVPNQVVIEKGPYHFSLPMVPGLTNVLGMRSGYTCCLANMHQGWTKFTEHLWYATPDKGVAALHFSPNQLTWKVGKENTEVVIDEITDYPFSDNILFQFTLKKPTAFAMHVRIPSWCVEASLSVNGELLRKDSGGQVVVVSRVWKNADKLTLQLPMKIKTSNWGRNSRSIERGPLVYALKLQEQWQTNKDAREGEYFTVSTKDDWNYGLLDSVIFDPATNVRVSNKRPVSDDFIWNLAHSPVELKTRAKKIPDWKILNDVAPQPVTSRDGMYLGKVEKETDEITLVPYGCTKVRIVAFPVVR